MFDVFDEGAAVGIADAEAAEHEGSATVVVVAAAGLDDVEIAVAIATCSDQDSVDLQVPGAGSAGVVDGSGWNGIGTHRGYHPSTSWKNRHPLLGPRSLRHFGRTKPAYQSRFLHWACRHRCINSASNSKVHQRHCRYCC